MSLCGFDSRCGRPLGHKGQHGGWRTGVRAERPGSVVRVVRRPHQDRPGAELSAAQVRSVVEYLLHGDHDEAARCIGMSPRAHQNHIESALARTGATSTAQIPYLVGWLRLPDGATRCAS